MVSLIICIICCALITVSAGEPTCFDLPCPLGTSYCAKFLSTSQDHRHLNIKITCLDEKNVSLKDHILREPSNAGPYTTVNNFYFKGVSNQNKNVVIRNYDGLEDML